MRATVTRQVPLTRAVFSTYQTPRAQAQFEAVAPAMRSANDTHVAARAHAILAQVYYPDSRVVSLVTRNIRDFGVRRLRALGIEVLRPDAFLLDRLQTDPQAGASALAALRSTLRSAPDSEPLLERLAADGQVLTAAAMFNASQQGCVCL